jgi:hypothetical protein
LELKELAKRLEHEKKEREDRAFAGNDATKQRAGGCTIPQPFNLHVDPQARQRRSSLEQKVRSEEMRECTFKPQTMEGRNRFLIERILNEDSEIMDDEDERR